MKTNLCNTIVTEFKSALKVKPKCGLKVHSILETGSVSGFITHCDNIIGTTSDYGFQQPRDLFKVVLEAQDYELAIYNTDTMHKECHDLIRLGFCYLEGSYLKLSKEVITLLAILEHKKNLLVTQRSLKQLEKGLLEKL